ncbi:uncharacterized protein SCODWIG_01287 [Saccharomycodes ludwigii]|uniref:Genetic interactor of prohibitin 7, mitochondrial n=1 Tax=Saccharomycodes ludwigii TaxID=36035 RepID=A0A376B4A6_9ASCO|nr:uncharacterized protein SCODWIG_01287 [Saccharomycodes ludwigii]
MLKIPLLCRGSTGLKHQQTTDIPRSLLIKQHRRLNEETLGAGSAKNKNETNTLFITSLKDITGFFNPGGFKDEEYEQLHLDKLNTLANNGALQELLLLKFGIKHYPIKPMDNQDPIPIKLMLESWKTLTFEELELLNFHLDQITAIMGMTNNNDGVSNNTESKIDGANHPEITEQQQTIQTNENKTGDSNYIDFSSLEYLYTWKNLPIQYKQLLYYRSYGSYGPREDLVFPINPHDPPQDLIWKQPSVVVNGNGICTDGKIKVRKLIASELNNVWKCSEARMKYLNTELKRIDPVSRFIIWIIFGVSLYCLYQDKTLEQKEKKENGKKA